MTLESTKNLVYGVLSFLLYARYEYKTEKEGNWFNMKILANDNCFLLARFTRLIFIERVSSMKIFGVISALLILSISVLGCLSKRLISIVKVPNPP